MKLLSLSAVALCLALAQASFFSFSNDESSEQWEKKVFARPGHQYKFNYNAQLSAAYAPWVSTQASVLRFAAPVHLTFSSDRSAIMRLPEVFVGHMNEQIDSTQLQHKKLSESVDVNESALKALRLPIQITMADGVVERVQFAKQDPTWSRNIKKAIVQLFQITLKKISFLPLKESTEQTSVFTEVETNLEGECPVVYTVAQTGNQAWNVTKSIQFQSCQKLSDSAYGYQSDLTESQLRRRHAQRDSGLSQELKNQMLQQPIPAEKLDRSTTYRFQLRADKDGKKIALLNTELVSDFQVKSTKSEDQTSQQVVALARLQLKSVEKVVAEKVAEKLDEEETLLYDSKHESDEKRFYMYGDEEFPISRSPFEYEQTESARVEKIETVLREIAHDIEKNPHESKQEIISKISEVLRQVRKCSLKSLRQIRDKQQTSVEKELFDDLLAMAATRNPIALLTEQIPKMRLVQSLKALKSISGTIFAPSDLIAKHIFDLCKNVDQENQALHQSCWIAFSSVVGQLNQQQQQAQYSAVYPTKKEEMQMERKLQEFQEVLEKRWNSASTEYERVLALKCLANAGIEKTLNLLEKIIRDNKQQSTFIRTEAIDALRRMRFTQPARLQQILLPVFMNTNEQPETRMAALSLIVSTLSVQPQKTRPVIDQIMFTLNNERSEQVRAFTYSLCQSYAKSPVSFERKVAQQMSQSIHIASLDEEDMLRRASRSIRVPIYSEQEQEGLFIGANMAFSPESLLPTHVATYVDSMLNGFVNKHSIYVSACQQNADKWLQRLVRKARTSIRSSSNMKNAEELKKLLKNIKIEKRSEQSETPFAMLTIRVKDVDRVVLPLTDEYFTQLLEGAQSAQQWGDFFQISKNLEGRFHSLISAHECALTVPTATGFKLQVEQLVVALANGKAKIEATVDLKQHIKSDLTIDRAHLIVEHQQQMYIVNPLAKFERLGVSSQRTVEIQHPKNVRLNLFASYSKGIKVESQIDEQKVRILSVRSLPFTFVGQQTIRTVQNRQLLPHQREINYNRNTLRVHGLVHKPLDWTRPAEILKTLLTAENYLTVDYMPTQQYQQAVTFKAQGFIFSPATLEESLAKELKNFAKNHRQIARKNEWTAESDDEFDSEEQDRANKYMTSYPERISTAGTKNKAYKHGLTLVAESGENKSELRVTLTCDASFTACRVHLQAERPAIAEYDEKRSEQWKMDLKCDYLLPENLKQTAHNQFIAVVTGKWGQALEQHFVAHISAKPQQKFPEDLALFINDFSASVNYKLSQESQWTIQSLYEVFKAYNFFGSELYYNKDKISTQKDQIRARLAIEPYSRRAFNLTIQTPQELLRLENRQSPMKLGFWVQQQQRRPAYHSVTSMVNRAVDETRSECRLQNNDIVRTFTSSQIRAPLSHRCFTILAKDCQNTGEPQFIVMAKKQTNERRNSNKIVKIVTPEVTIEAMPVSEESPVEEIKLRINGKEVKPYQQNMENVEYDGEQLYARLDGVSVRFDGQKLSVKLSQEFSQAQCGLCGEMNAESDDTYRTASNDETDSVSEFHRSYIVREEKCDDEHLNDFYGNQQQRESRFRQLNGRRQQQFDEEDSEESDEWESREYNGKQRESNSMEEDDEFDYETGKKQTIAPRQEIHVAESNHKICFSMKPIKTCPEESYSVDEKETREEMDYACYKRQSADARRLQRAVRRANQQSKVPSLEKLAQELNLEVSRSLSRQVTVQKMCQRV